MIGHKPINLYYIAGFFDGEGCITAFKRHTESKGHGQYRCVINITNTNKYLLQLIADYLHCGKVYEHSVSLNRKPCFTLHFSAMESYRVLNLLVPFLVEKYNQAQTALDYLEYRFSNLYRQSDEINEYFITLLKNRK